MVHGQYSVTQGTRESKGKLWTLLSLVSYGTVPLKLCSAHYRMPHIYRPGRFRLSTNRNGQGIYFALRMNTVSLIYYAEPMLSDPSSCR